MSGPAAVVSEDFAPDRHRPVDRAVLAAAAVELAARGLTPRDIAAALRLSEAAVLELLGLQVAPCV